MRTCEGGPGSGRPATKGTAMSVTSEEARKSFHDDLDDLRTDVIRLAALVTEAIGAGTQSLLDADLAAAERLIVRDDVIDDLNHAIEDRCYLLLATQQPVASDLRVIVTTLRVIHELERSGDLMVNVAKSTRRLYPHSLDPKIRGILDQMGEQAANQTRLALDAFADADPSAAAALSDMDDVMDDLTKSLFRAILSSHTTSELDEATLQQAVQVALIGRHYERIADHAVTIAQRVRFMVTGIHPQIH
ncbi:MAG: phosphate transport system regulatory protein PhoU [Actinomycetia bacterium]|nr:phosphate transport system regulatory protein PhoU [Actinomycetes bacterium]